jgi:hypothetical protein
MAHQQRGPGRRRGPHGSSSVARASTAASRAHASAGREVTAGLAAGPWCHAEKAAAWEQRWDRLGAERERSEHWGPVPVRPAPVRPAWASDEQPDYQSDGGGLTPAIGAYDRAAWARQEKEDAAFLAANERRKRDVLVTELARLQAEVDSLDRQVFEAGEARRLAGRLFHDETVKSQMGESDEKRPPARLLMRLPDHQRVDLPQSTRLSLSLVCACACGRRRLGLCCCQSRGASSPALRRAGRGQLGFATAGASAHDGPVRAPWTAPTCLPRGLPACLPACLLSRPRC